MQIAINIILFVLGFTAATLFALRPRKTRKNFLRDFTSHLSQVTIDNIEGKLESIDADGTLEHATDEEMIQSGAEHLLTKCVCGNPDDWY